MTLFRFVKIFIHVIVFLAPILSMLGQEAHLDVEGLTKIRGRIDVNVMEDSSVVVIGRNAGLNMTFSSFDMQNTFVGSSAGRSNTFGNSNSFFGSSAGRSNTYARSNSFFGYASGTINTTGSANSFFGSSAGRSNTTGSANSFFGRSAGQSNTTGDRNVSIGTYSGGGSGDTSMNKSTYVGYEAGYYFSSNQIERTGNVFLGYQSGKGESHSHRLYIENSDADSTGALIYGRFDTDELSFNANVGINTTEPDGQLEVNGNSGLAIPHVLLTETGAGDYARLRFKNSSIDEKFWDIAGRPKVDGNEATASINFYYNDPALDVLKLFGDGDATLAGSLTEMSDRRLKKNILELSDVLPQISQITGYRYEWIRDKKRSPQIGLIAQEVMEVFPELVKKDDEGMLSVSYSKFVPILLEGIKEQNEIIVEMENQNIALKSRLSKVEEELYAIRLMLLETKED